MTEKRIRRPGRESGLDRTKDGELTKAGGRDLVEVSISLDEMNDVAARHLVARLAQVLRVGHDTLELLDPKTEYVLRLPSWFLGDSDDMWLNHRKGDPDAILPEIMQYNDEGKKVIVKQIDAFERPARDAVEGAGRDLSSALGDIALRRQLGECVERLKQLGERVEVVIAGQMDDRIARINGAMTQVRAALASGDEEHIVRRRESAVPLLNVGIEQVQSAMRRRAIAFSDIPNGGPGIIAKLLTDPDFIFQMNREFDAVQDCFEYLQKAYLLLAIADVMAGQPDSAKAVLGQMQLFLDGDVPKLMHRFESLHPELDFSDEWFEAPEAVVALLEQTVKELSPNGQDSYLIELKGDMLLEMGSDDKDE